MAVLPRPVTMMIDSIPEATASSTTYWMVGLSTRGSISLGWALVTGRKRVPRPAAGMMARRMVRLVIPENVPGGQLGRRRRGRDAAASGPPALAVSLARPVLGAARLP